MFLHSLAVKCNGSYHFPLQHASYSWQMNDLPPQSKLYAYLKGRKIYVIKLLTASNVHHLFLLWSAANTDCWWAAENRGPAQLYPHRDAQLHHAHNGRQTWVSAMVHRSEHFQSLRVQSASSQKCLEDDQLPRGWDKAGKPRLHKRYPLTCLYLLPRLVTHGFCEQPVAIYIILLSSVRPVDITSYPCFWLSLWRNDLLKSGQISSMVRLNKVLQMDMLQEKALGKTTASCLLSGVLFDSSFIISLMKDRLCLAGVLKVAAYVRC